MKKVIASTLVYFAALLLCSCSKGGVETGSNVNAAVSSSTATSSQSVPDSAAESSSAVKSDEPEMEVSYNMNDWQWYEQALPGYSITLPEGIYVEGDKLYASTDVLPKSAFDLTVYPSIIAWVYEGTTDADISPVDEETYYYTPLEGEACNLILSDDPTLPLNTFYRFNNYIAYTMNSPVGGDGSRPLYPKQTVYTPQDGVGPTITFYAEPESAEGKPLFERIIGSIVVNPASAGDVAAIDAIEPAYQLDTAISGVVSTGGSGLNLRTGPGTEYEAIVLVPDGATLSGTGTATETQNPEWLYVNYEGQNGWINTGYIV